MTEDEQWKSAEEVRIEIEEKLRNDPAYRSAVEASETTWRLRAAALDNAEQPILADLHRAGVDVNSVWNLAEYPVDKFASVIIYHLQKGGYPERIMEAMGRAFKMPASHRYWGELLELYLSSEDPGACDGLASSLAHIARRADIRTLIDLLNDESKGDTRIYFLRSIKRYGGVEGRLLLQRLKDSKIFGAEASALLRRDRSTT